MFPMPKIVDKFITITRLTDDSFIFEMDEGYIIESRADIIKNLLKVGAIPPEIELGLHQMIYAGADSVLYAFDGTFLGSMHLGLFDRERN